MQNIHFIKNKNWFSSLGMIALCLTVFLTSCDFEYPLPEAGSLPDETPPSAAFSHEQDDANYLQVDFTNLSASATSYSWNFGDGNSSTSKDPSNTYAGDGTYTVTLTSRDDLGVETTVSRDILVEEPVVFFVPVILEASFEDESLPDGSGDGRDSWRNDAGGVIQITSGPVFDGSQAAKLPSAGDRVGQQLIAVLPDTDYVLSFYYTMKTDPGTLTVAVLNGMIADVADLGDNVIASTELTDNSDANTYVKVSLPFNTGENTEVAIYFGNEGSECRLDKFSIQ